MGISGLLPILRSITNTVHVKEYKGKKVAVDTYVWLHKASYSCSSDLCQGIPTDKYVDYCMHRVKLLQHFGVIPVLVFDGDTLPAKKHTEASRFKSRMEHKQKGLECLAAGNDKEAREHFQKAVEISPDVAYRLITRLMAEGIEFIVSPYEADAQLAYLSINDLVHAVITEDSDLLVYGCKRVLFKMDKFGSGEEVCLNNIGSITEPVNFQGFDLKKFRHMCILSGCDYLASVTGMGLKKAHSLLRIHSTAKRVISVLRNKGMDVPKDYEQAFEQAELTFLHQRVWDPVNLRLVTLYPLPDELAEMDQSNLLFLGQNLTREEAKNVATGVIHPETKQKYATPIPVKNSRGFRRQSINTPPKLPTPKIENFFSPAPKPSLPNTPILSQSVNSSPYFTSKNQSPVMPANKSKFLINRSSSSPVLKLPRPFVQKSDIQTTPKKSPIPNEKQQVVFKLSSKKVSVNVIKEKENHILEVTSKYFSASRKSTTPNTTRHSISAMHKKFVTSPK